MPTLIAIACTACHTPLATMRDDRLYVGAVVFARSTELVCQHCGKKRVWWPPKAEPSSS